MGENNKTVFVTGGHGFVGSFVVRNLIDRGYTVRLLVRESSKTHRVDELPVEKFVGDILDMESMREGMAGCDFCIHLAGISAYKDMQEDWTIPTIVEGTRNVFELASQLDLERVVYIGSGITYASHDPDRIATEDSPFLLGDSGLFYAIGKHKADALVDTFVTAGLDIVVAIPMETYGPQDDQFLTTGYLKEAINSWPALATRGGTSFAHVADVAEGICLSLENGRAGERYILGGDNATIKEIIQLTLEVAGRPKAVLVLPTGLTKFVLRSLHNLGLPSPEHPNAVDYGTLYGFTTSDKAKAELGYSPRSSRAVIESTVDWLRQSGHIS
jgi:dihydroflavonol-4-reductase